MDAYTTWRELLAKDQHDFLNSKEKNIEGSYPDVSDFGYKFDQDVLPTGKLSGLLRMAANSLMLMYGDFDVVYDQSVLVDYSQTDDIFYLSAAGALFITRSQNLNIDDFVNGNIDELEYCQLDDQALHICKGVSLLENKEYCAAGKHFGLSEEELNVLYELENDELIAEFYLSLSDELMKRRL